jgi:hypothetical protein
MRLVRGADRGPSSFQAIARLKPSVTPGQARSAMRAVLADVAHDYPETNRYRLEAGIISIRGWVTRQVRPTLITLLGAVAFVLLIG